jgi:dolichyl-phosphate-mannose-protein mannosyltransferase
LDHGPAPHRAYRRLGDSAGPRVANACGGGKSFVSGPRRLTALDLALLFGLALAANGIAAHFITLPGYVDAYYYSDGAAQLAHGHGFTEPYLWNYLAPPAVLASHAWRWPGFLYWMPLTSLVATPAMALAERAAGGPLPNDSLFRAAQLTTIVLGSLLPLLSYGTTRLLGLGRRHGLAAGLLTVLSPFYFVYWTNTDAFALFALLTAGALVAGAMAVNEPRRVYAWLLLAGLGAGLAHLARADGILVLGCLVAWVWLLIPGGRGLRARFVGVAVVVGGYIVVMGPWFVRNLVVAGAPLPPGSIRSLWLTAYDDFFSFPTDRLTLAGYLASGAGNVLAGKWMALRSNLATLAVAPGGFTAFPFALLGLWRLRRQPAVQLSLFYGAVLLAAMSLVFTFPGMRGGFFHSAASLLPFWMPAAVAGLDAAVDAAARRLPHWQPKRSRPIFTALLVLIAAGLSIAVFWTRVIGPDPSRPAWSKMDQAYRDAGAWFRSQGRGDELVVVNNPPGWYYNTSRSAIVIPSGGRAELLAAMTAFDARWVFLDSNHPAALEALYRAPDSDANLHLRATFSGVNGQPAYLFELEPFP